MRGRNPPSVSQRANCLSVSCGCFKRPFWIDSGASLKMSQNPTMDPFFGDSPVSSENSSFSSTQRYRQSPQQCPWHKDEEAGVGGQTRLCAQTAPGPRLESAPSTIRLPTHPPTLGLPWPLSLAPSAVLCAPHLCFPDFTTAPLLAGYRGSPNRRACTASHGKLATSGKEKPQESAAALPSALSGAILKLIPRGSSGGPQRHRAPAINTPSCWRFSFYSLTFLIPHRCFLR